MGSSHEEIFNAASMPAVESQFGVDVVFSRGALNSAAFTARRGDRDHRAMGGEYGLEISVTMRDFWLPVASVVVGGETIEPRAGDRITEGDEVFEVAPPDDEKPAVERPAGGFDWLVHTKRIE